jgi:hypothetical protein
MVKKSLNVGVPDLGKLPEKLKPEIAPILATFRSYPVPMKKLCMSDWRELSWTCVAFSIIEFEIHHYCHYRSVEANST